MSGNIPDPAVRRLPAYYRQLQELETQGVVVISSLDLGNRMQLTPSQVRLDIKTFGGTGRSGFGYPVKELKEHIRKMLGLDQDHPMVVLGAGSMGLEIAGNAGLAREGFPVVALFDRDPARAALRNAAVPVYSEEELENRLPSLNAQIGVLALPADAAQEMLDRLYNLGIRAVWNFSPVDLHYPRDMAVVNMHLDDTLQILSYRIKRMEAEFSRR